MSTFHTQLVDRVELTDIPTTKWHACKSVLRAIAEHANEAEADMAWPGVELLMLETGASESVITRTTTLLAKHGWITKKRRHGTSNIYRINVAKLQQHQAQRPEAGTVYMAEHLPGLEFEHEQTASGTAPKQRRSTARSRVQQGRTQGTRQIDGTDPSNRRDRPVKSTAATRQIDDRTTREPTGNHQPTNARAHAREEPAGEPSPAGQQWMDGEVSDHNNDETSALELINDCLPAGSPRYRVRNDDRAVVAVLQAREVLSDDEIRQVLAYNLAGTRTPAAVLRTHRTAELLAVLDKREDEAGRPVHVEDLPALWCTHCDGIAVVVTTPDGSKSRRRCSAGCASPRPVPPWVWQHISDRDASATKDDGKEAAEAPSADLQGAIAAGGTGKAQATYTRPSERGEDPGEVVAARKRELSRYAQKFGALASGGTPAPHQ